MVLIFHLSPGEVIFLAKWNINLKSVQEDVKCNLPTQFAFPLWRSEWGRLLQKTCPFFPALFLLFDFFVEIHQTPDSKFSAWGLEHSLPLGTDDKHGTHKTHQIFTPQANTLPSLVSAIPSHLHHSEIKHKAVVSPPGVLPKTNMELILHNATSIRNN